ncbi:DUF2782 domain-containing protein [Oceanobacter mangrovi]|uniref:DUF2782 domain-containing protein n=1 Tax=Oceanobacter mangrovi TaxID=2862510 RepID=UPI001C8CFDAB|nr:DUF2782 domain-containing protein [Oceanobacter mangrovi]
MKTLSRRSTRTLISASLLALTALLPLTSQAENPAGESVTIRNDGDNTYYEFRENGQLVEIKVEPKTGKPYYLVPKDGPGEEFVRKDNPDVVVPKWVIFRW